MINELEINNFKSIKYALIECKQINVFIGEPNSGKSNFLEVLGFLSCLGHFTDLRSYIRLNKTINLYYDELLDNEISIRLNDVSFGMKYEYDSYVVKEKEGNMTLKFNHEGDYSGGSSGVKTVIDILKAIKSFKYKEMPFFRGQNPGFLEPPHGENLFSVVYSNKEYREVMKNFIRDFGFNLVFRPQERTFEYQKQVEDIIISYPYILAPDTVKTIIFYLFAIMSNKNTSLVFEEPEAHAFPYYTKFIGEKIAFDKVNQYFIATHNPYFLSSILEKTPKKNLNIFITYFEDYQTKFKLLKEKQIREILDYETDLFFNIKTLYEE